MTVANRIINNPYNETPMKKGTLMKKYIDNLKRQAEDNPLLALGVGAALLTAVTKLINANTERNNAKTWEREVDRRRMK